MILKIFEAGTFTEADINAFYAENIIFKDIMNADGKGSVYLWYKPKTKLGLDPIDTIKKLDNLVTKAEDSISTHKLDLIEDRIDLENIKAEIAKIDPNQKKEWDELQDARKKINTKILMGENSIEGFTAQIELWKAYHQELLNPKASNEEVKG